MPFVAVRDINVYYELAGVGPRLLYINGTGGDLRRKPNVFDSPLVDRFTILSYDQRGLGQTDRPETPYTMADYAEDANALLSALGWERCLVMGVSFGGMVAQEFAVRYPERIEKLVLACTSSGGAGGASYPLHELLDLDLRAKTMHMMGVGDLRQDAAWQAANPHAVQELLEMAEASAAVGADEPNRELGARLQLLARKEHDTFDRLPTLTMPVFICGGRFDGTAPVDNLYALQDQIPHAQLALFDGGHGFLQQDPAAYVQIIKFLENN
ncbi:MAG TPA: alpha/beta hydrolase [Caldilineaceae bacterium]|nr:alpha/beta hydrolase [Caldilineaceae bacterium]